MPCYEVNTITVEFKVAHRDLLDQAIQSLGWPCIRNGNDYTICPSPAERNILLNLSTGEARVYPPKGQERLNELKRAYSREVLKLVTKHNGWQLQQTSATKGNIVRSYT